MKLDKLLEATKKAPVKKQLKSSSELPAESQLLKDKSTIEDPIKSSSDLFYEILKIITMHTQIDSLTGMPKINTDAAITEIKNLPGTNALTLSKAIRLLQRSNEDTERFLLKLRKSLGI